MSVSNLVTRGFGNGVLIGSIAYAVTIGYDISEVTNPWTDKVKVTTTWSTGVPPNSMITGIITYVGNEPVWADKIEITTTWTDKT